MVKRASTFGPQTLLSAPRRSPGVPNPSGTKILYTVNTYSFETHSKTNEFRILDVASGESQPIPGGSDIRDPNWLNDEEVICLEAGTGGDNNLQIYVADNSASSGLKSLVKFTLSGPGSNLKIAPLDDGCFAVVFSAPTTPNGRMFNEHRAKPTQSTGRLYNSLLVRHWDQYETKIKNALFYCKLSTGGFKKYQLSMHTNALKGANCAECPISPFGSTDNFDVCKEGIIFVSKDPGLDPALNTKCNLYLRKIDDWAKDCSNGGLLCVQPPGFEGAITSPVFSADGSRAAFLAMRTNGYEADQNHLFVLEHPFGHSYSVQQRSSRSFDRSPGAICFVPDGEGILAIADDRGSARLFLLTDGMEPVGLTGPESVADVKVMKGGCVFVTASTLLDNSLYMIISLEWERASQTKRLVQWQHSSSGHGNKFGLKEHQVSTIWTPASNPSINRQIHSWVVKPSFFNPSKKYPVAYLIHGGPQGAWGNSWSTRWNPAVFAEQGYIVIAPNPTGSTGYGQALTDSIRDNWGGDPYHDIVNVFDWVSENMPEADNGNAVALGASYGGYMMNWIQGHDLGRKLKCLVCHDGIFSLGGMLATEELYFPFHDLKGAPWKASSKDDGSPAQVKHNFGHTSLSNWAKWDPTQYLDNWQTPQLVIHNSKDYRICISDGLAAFNVLQARGVESQLLTFPDENHFVLKPENSLVWHKVVLNWINHYTGLPKFAEEENEQAFLGGTRKGEIIEMEGQGRPET